MNFTTKKNTVNLLGLNQFENLQINNADEIKGGGDSIIINDTSQD